jgi:glutathione S-transferase
MAAIKLYYSPEACSLASHILLHETGVDFEAIKIDVKAGAPEELRRINPKMRVPVLSLDDQIITETPAIMTAISQLAPEKILMGNTSLETVHVYEWLNWLSGTLHTQGFGELFRPHRFSDDPAMYEAIRAKGLETVEECFDMIERGLSSVNAVGDSFTAVDAFLFVFWRWGARSRTINMEKYPKFSKLVVNLAKRPSFQAVVDAEGVDSYVPRL